MKSLYRTFGYFTDAAKFFPLYLKKGLSTPKNPVLLGASTWLSQTSYLIPSFCKRRLQHMNKALVKSLSMDSTNLEPSFSENL